jgi:hypothetical protein
MSFFTNTILKEPNHKSKKGLDYSMSQITQNSESNAILGLFISESDT